MKYAQEGLHHTIRMQGDTTALAAFKSCAASFVCSHHRNAVVTEMQSSQKCSCHRNAVVTEMQSSQKCSRHRSAVVSEMQSSHKCSHHTNAVITQTQSSQKCLAMSCKVHAEVLNQLLRLTKHIMMWLQQDALALLCDMADFSFYRPAIRKAEPGKMVAQTLFQGWSQVYATASIVHV